MTGQALRVRSLASVAGGALPSLARLFPPSEPPLGRPCPSRQRSRR